MIGEIPHAFIIFAYLFAAAVVFLVVCFLIPVHIMRFLIWRRREQYEIDGDEQ